MVGSHTLDGIDPLRATQARLAYEQELRRQAKKDRKKARRG